MLVYAITMGKNNYAWDKCKARPSIATMDWEELFPFWKNKDKKSYIQHCIANLPTKSGNPPTKSTASGYYNQKKRLTNSDDDIWVCKQGDMIWWTKTTDSPAEYSAKPIDIPELERPAYEIHKPCLEWSNKNKKGIPLIWQNIHPKAQGFFTPRHSFVKISIEDYVIALIEGNDLSQWHNSSDWIEKAGKNNWQSCESLDYWDGSVKHMAQQAETTSRMSNGEISQKTIKNKDFKFGSKQEAEKYLAGLLKEQQGLCAISGLPLQRPENFADENMLCSLDRINSNGDYEAGNLQVVCRFINFWKSDSEDKEFRRLLKILRN